MTLWRWNPLRLGKEMVEPEWANVHYLKKPDFQAILPIIPAPNKKPKV